MRVQVPVLSKRRRRERRRRKTMGRRKAMMIRSVWLYVGSGDFNSGSHPCTSSSLPMEPSPRLEPSKVVPFTHPLPPPRSHVDCFLLVLNASTTPGVSWVHLERPWTRQSLPWHGPLHAGLNESFHSAFPLQCQPCSASQSVAVVTGRVPSPRD